MPLHYAARQGHCNVAILLMEKGASIYDTGPGDRTVLDYAKDCFTKENFDKVLEQHFQDISSDQSSQKPQHTIHTASVVNIIHPSSPIFSKNKSPKEQANKLSVTGDSLSKLGAKC